MAVAVVHRRIGGQAVEIAVAVDVGDPDALALGQHHVERLVVVGAEPALDIDEIGGVERHGWPLLSGVVDPAARIWVCGRSSTVRPNRLVISSVRSTALRPRSSRNGLSSTTSSEPTMPLSRSEEHTSELQSLM